MVIVEMKKHFPLRAIEWWSAGLMASWGAMVLLQPRMFEQLEALRPMTAIAPQYIWGFFAFTLGLLRLAALTINGFWYPTPIIRLMTATFSVFVWFWIVVGIWLGPVLNVGLVVYGWHMIADIYSAFRSASDTYEAEAQRRVRNMETSFKMDEGPNVHRLGRK